jgi:hypothetical protein
MRFLIALAVVVVAAYPQRSFADGDTLLPVTFKSFPADFRKALVKATVKDALVPVNCLDGSAGKRKVCTYKIGTFMSVMVESQKGGSDAVGITLICAASTPLDSGKCLLSYSAAMALTASDMNIDARGKILKLLLDGLDVGNSTTIATDDRKFILQKSLGLWFQVLAADVED